MQIGICAAPQTITGFSELPFDFIEGHVQEFLKPEAPDAAFAPNLLAARGCARPMPAANCLFPPDLKVTGPAVDYARMERYVDVAFARARSIGLTVIVFGSAGARQLPDGWSASTGFEQYVEALRRLAPIAQRHGVAVVVEPLNRGECNLINTIEEGALATRRCGHPHVRLLVDLFHMLRNGEPPDAIRHHADLITHAHLAENVKRAEPGVNGDDFRPYLRALRHATLCQRLTIEAVWSRDLAAAAGPSIAEVRRQLAESGY